MTRARQRFAVFVIEEGAAIADAELFGVWRDRAQAKKVAERTWDADEGVSAMVMEVRDEKSARAIVGVFGGPS